MTRNCPEKTLKIVFYQRRKAAVTWQDPTDWTAVDKMIADLREELLRFGVTLTREEDPDSSIEIRGYGDILNSIRLRYPVGGFANTCLGHVIGQSANRDLATDIRRGVNRLLFAPETVEPQGSDKVVCHNCGCGC